jgi:hypothetical protein
MGTKRNPGPHDCHAKAGDDEPIFTLRAKDPIAPEIVRLWAAVRGGNIEEVNKVLDEIAVHVFFARQAPEDSEKLNEARKVADDMRQWGLNHALEFIQERLMGKKRPQANEAKSSAVSSPPTTSFSVALMALKGGEKIRRRGWNGKDMFLFLVPGSTFKVNRPPLLGIYPPDTEIQYHGHIDMKTAQGYVVPWIASQADLLEEDWEVLK